MTPLERLAYEMCRRVDDKQRATCEHCATDAHGVLAAALDRHEIAHVIWMHLPSGGLAHTEKHRLRTADAIIAHLLKETSE